MEKIIIENRTDKPMNEVILYVLHVINGGRISKTSKGQQYCFLTTWKDGIAVSADRNKNSDKFIVWQQNK